MDEQKFEVNSSWMELGNIYCEVMEELYIEHPDDCDCALCWGYDYDER